MPVPQSKRAVSLTSKGSLIKRRSGLGVGDSTPLWSEMV